MKEAPEYLRSHQLETHWKYYGRLEINVHWKVETIIDMAMFWNLVRNFGAHQL